VIELLEPLLGVPVALDELKHKPGRRRTLRASGPAGTAIVKVYASTRAPVVASRIGALGHGPREPEVPRVLIVEPARHAVVLSDLDGIPFREAILAEDAETCARVGHALGAWHSFWIGRRPWPLRNHRVEHELAVLQSHMEAASSAVTSVLRPAADVLAAEWRCSTVVHRDLYEEQILVGERVGLIDLDDAALGPPELDIGNLSAHVQLLGLRSGRMLGPALQAMLEGYASSGPTLDPELLERCRTLSLLRLACIHGDPALTVWVRKFGFACNPLFRRRAVSFEPNSRSSVVKASPI
jgi:Ser/Thr protein kinase RdoA (MazF antagonist)